jgi:hypothetical protein
MRLRDLRQARFSSFRIFRQPLANAMADSEHAPMSGAIAGGATGQLAIVSNSGTEATAIPRWCSVDDGQLAVLLGGLSERLLECALATGPAGDR